jgi:hypothetical protein
MGATPALLPCKLVDGYFIKNWHTTGTIPEQLQAAAVEAGCEWCPLWHPVLYDLAADGSTIYPCNESADQLSMKPLQILE